MSDRAAKGIGSLLQGSNYRTRIVFTLAGVAGLAVAIALVVHSGLHDVVRILAHGGWALLWLIPFHLLAIALDASGWRVLLRGQRRATLPFLIWVASVRDSVNNLLPVARVGGEVAGVRLLMLRKISGTEAAASIIVEITLTLIVQLCFTLIGITILLDVLGRSNTARDLFITLGTSVPLVAAFLVVQRRWGLFEPLARLFAAVTKNKQFPGVEDSRRLDSRIQALYRNPVPLVATALWQATGLLAGAAELWFALYLLGYAQGPLAAVFLESLAQAIQAVSFFVPAGLGVQEGGFMFLGSMIGLPPDASLALSLTRRLRQLGFGIPALMSWQWVEARQLRRNVQTRSQQMPLK
ncbi:MAG: lysylphosphatidylglycerol synthase domain-containing protein [Acidiferrobacteraceae bacterium]